MRTIILQIGFTAIVALVSSGCGPAGPEKYEVSGTVTYAGKPVSSGDVIFIPEDTSLAPEAGKIVDGRFTALAKAGKCRVEITALDIGPDTPVMMGSPIASNYIPEKYNRESTLAIEVKPNDDNVYEFPLEP